MNYMLLDCSGKGAVVNVPREVVKYFFGLFQERRSAAIWQHDICAEVFSKFEGSPSHFSRKWQSNSSLGGLPYMTSAMGGGGGSPKSRQKEQNQMICDNDKGEGVKNPKILRTSYMEAPCTEHNIVESKLYDERNPCWQHVGWCKCTFQARSAILIPNCKGPRESESEGGGVGSACPTPINFSSVP